MTVATGRGTPAGGAAPALITLAVLAGAALLPGRAAAQIQHEGADELPFAGRTVRPSPWKDFRVTLDGYLRVRGDVLDDLDLSRGPTPTTGQPIFPTPAGGEGHTITAADMRVRLEPTLEVGQAVKLHLRVDLLDNVGWGSTPDVLPSTAGSVLATTVAEPPSQGWNALKDSIRVKLAWGEVALPFGVLQAGRMAGLVPWGTGFFVNNGSCLSCDRGDSGDRVALTVPLLGHLVTGLYELTATGPSLTLDGQELGLERRAQVHTGALSVARWSSPEAQLRRLRAGRTLVQYGLLASYRRQALDAPGWSQAGGLTRAFGPGDFVRRELDAFAGDLWFMIRRKGFRAELEVATVLAQIGDASLVPGASLRSPVVARQFGGVLSLAYELRWPVRFRAEVGVASGDDSPGFGARADVSAAPTQAGDLDGPQVRPPVDYSLDNFRFNSDYRVDLILWRRIVGRVTDAVYVRPSVRLGPFGSPNHHVTFDLAYIDSNAMFPASAPGQARHLGDELDLQVRYRYEAGFEVSLAYGVFFPGAGFSNPRLNLEARPAQALELILAYLL